MSYREVGEARTAIGSGLAQLGVPPGATVGLYGVNSVGARTTTPSTPHSLLPNTHWPPLPSLPPHPHPPLDPAEWMLADAGAHAYGLTTVPLYDTLGPDTVRYIANHAELAAIACAAEVLARVLEVLPDCPSVRVVAVWGTRPHHRLPDPPAGCAARLLTLDRLRALGYKHPRPHRPPAPSDVALINYTRRASGGGAPAPIHPPRVSKVPPPHARSPRLPRHPPPVSPQPPPPAPSLSAAAPPACPRARC
jgi:long-chain acyl-CoA synthetase